MSQIEGTNFQKAVWEQLRKIPSGQTRTYKEIAILIGRPNSARAVANACAKKSLSTIIPCHSVINQNNETGGYFKEQNSNKKKSLLIQELT